ncbi:hypothetical protein TNCV_127481 [Trichonephila clavipes]|nr:hypothetical protein TNCV_127481 [Trichonephila clavipes]
MYVCKTCAVSPSGMGVLKIAVEPQVFLVMLVEDMWEASRTSPPECSSPQMRGGRTEPNLNCHHDETATDDRPHLALARHDEFHGPRSGLC